MLQKIKDIINKPDSADLEHRAKIQAMRKKSLRESEIEYHRALSDELKVAARKRAKDDAEKKPENKSNDLLQQMGNASKRMNNFWTQQI